jgi:hypothetical protein
MKQPLLRRAPSFPQAGTWFAAVIIALHVECAALAESGPALAHPLTYAHITRTNPNFSLHIATVNLADARIRVRVARGGADPDGDGPWTTTLLPTSEIAKREQFDLAVNGDFFVIPGAEEAGGIPPRYVRGTSARPRGWAMTDGELWHRTESKRPYVAITLSNTVQIAEAGPESHPDAHAHQIMGGGQIIVQHGKPVTYRSTFATNRHPRTVIGHDPANQRLVFLVVDGRQPQLSIGMTLSELSTEMLRLGCQTAVNLDGGGSTTMTYRRASDATISVMNSTSDRRERAVANVIGVSVMTSNATR